MLEKMLAKRMVQNMVRVGLTEEFRHGMVENYIYIQLNVGDQISGIWVDGDGNKNNMYTVTRKDNSGVYGTRLA